MVEYLKNISFVTNSIYLLLKEKIICKSHIKYFIYKLRKFSSILSLCIDSWAYSKY